MNDADQTRHEPHSELMAIMMGGLMAEAAYTATELSLPELLAAGSMHFDELAQTTATHAPSVRRLLRALASLGLCSDAGDGIFAASELGHGLRPGATGSMYYSALWFGRHRWPYWRKLLHSVRTGESGRKHDTGRDGFHLLERDAIAAFNFNQMMVETTRLVATDVVRCFDFSNVQSIVDVGGGHGALLSGILTAHTGIAGTVYDLPHAITGNANLGQKLSLQAISGDFFHAVPSGAEVYLLKDILHDWTDELSIKILRNCRTAMEDDGKVLIVERLMPPRIEPCAQHRLMAAMDLTMLVETGGRERTLAEFAGLLDAAGMMLDRVLTTGHEYSILVVRARQ